MITEDYVSFETAKLLKEKGFDGILPFIYVVTEKNKKVHLLDTIRNYNDEHIKDVISAPTFQMAMKWLREVYNIDINIYVESISHKKRYTVTVWKNIQEDGAINDAILGVFTIYEEACEAAIKYCLENLI